MYVSILHCVSLSLLQCVSRLYSGILLAKMYSMVAVLLEQIMGGITNILGTNCISSGEEETLHSPSFSSLFIKVMRHNTHYNLIGPLFDVFFPDI